MAVIIDTAHRVAGKFGLDPYGVSMDGFTSGNLAGGELPTELHPDWFDSAQQEINNAIIPGLGFALDALSYTQLAESVESQIVGTYPRWSFSPIYEFRSQSDDALTGNGTSCHMRRRTNYSPSCAAGSVNSTVIFNVPTNSQNFVRFTANCVQTDLSTNYGNVEWKGSVKNLAGVVTVQTSSASFSDITLAGLTFAIVVVGANIVLRVTIPAAPAGKFHNIFGYGEITNVLMTP